MTVPSSVRPPAAPRIGPAVALVLLALLAALAVPAQQAGPLRADTQLELAASDLPRAAAVAVFATTYLVLAIGRLPGSRLDRAGAALLSGSLMVAVGALTTEAAYRAIDADTITLLLGMMILVGNLRLSGFFGLVNGWVAARARSPLVLLVGVVWSAGILSAFLVNDAICLVLAPLVLELVIRLRRDPRPYLLAVAMASNVGSVATITGNPQNMMIGSLSGIPYTSFLRELAPVALLGLTVTTVMIAACYRREFWGGGRLEGGWRPRRAHRPLVTKATLVTVGMVAAFLSGVPPAEAAIVAGALLLLTRRIKPEKVYREIDLPLLLMFAGLFVTVAGFDAAVMSPEVIAAVGRLGLDQVPMLSLVTAALSNLVSNVPAVLVLEPFVANLPDQQQAWLTIAMASTLAGNFSLLGSVANLIVVQRARRHGVTIGFWEYFKVGAPLTVATILIGIWWLGR